MKQLFVERLVPFNRAIGLRLKVRRDGCVSMRLPPRRRNANVSGTVHGAVIAAFAETAHGVAVLWHFSPAEHSMVTRRLAVEYLRPAKGELLTDYVLDEATASSIEEQLELAGRCEVRLESIVTSLSGDTVARLVGVYLVRRNDRRQRPQGT